jgi:hypothetical protein
MYRLSMQQALSIWSDLEAAYYRRNGFGGDTAEIYMYRLMPRCPGGEESLAGRKCDLFDDMAKELISNANKALYSLLKHFAEVRNVNIEVYDNPLGPWLKHADYSHRVHVKVTPNQG